MLHVLSIYINQRKFQPPGAGLAGGTRTGIFPRSRFALMLSMESKCHLLITTITAKIFGHIISNVFLTRNPSSHSNNAYIQSYIHLFIYLF